MRKERPIAGRRGAAAAQARGGARIFLGAQATEAVRLQSDPGCCSCVRGSQAWRVEAQNDDARWLFFPSAELLDGEHARMFLSWKHPVNNTISGAFSVTRQAADGPVALAATRARALSRLLSHRLDGLRISPAARWSMKSVLSDVFGELRCVVPRRCLASLR